MSGSAAMNQLAATDPAEARGSGGAASADSRATATWMIADDPSGVPPDQRLPEPLRARLLRPQTLISFGVAAAIIVFFARRLEIDAGAVWRNVRQANPALYALGFALYYASYGARAVRWRWMLTQAGVTEANGCRLPSNRRLMEFFLLAWFVNCVVPAKVGDAYRSYLLKRESRASFSIGLGTIIAERLADLTVLFVIMTAMGGIAFRGHLPEQATRTLAVGLGLIVVGLAGMVGLWLGRQVIERRLPGRVRGQFLYLHGAIFACLRRPWPPLVVSALIWGLDGLRLYLVAAALGAELTYPTATFVALMSALLTILPITPAGLGVVEVAMIGVFKLVGLDVDLAGSIALLDRVVTYWSLVAVGSILYIRRFRADVW